MSSRNQLKKERNKERREGEKEKKRTTKKQRKEEKEKKASWGAGAGGWREGGKEVNVKNISYANGEQVAEVNHPILRWFQKEKQMVELFSFSSWSRNPAN